MPRQHKPDAPSDAPGAALLQDGSADASLLGHNRVPGQNIGGWAPRPCPECMRLFEPNVANQLFCCPAHNAAWNNRQTKRGRVLTGIDMAAYITRNGTRGPAEHREAGKRAGRDRHRLIQRWRDEDAQAGRMAHPEYNARRYKAGLEIE